MAAMIPVVVFSPKPILGSSDLSATRDCQPYRAAASVEASAAAIVTAVTYDTPGLA
jgi:hypothetical protein